MGVWGQHTALTPVVLVLGQEAAGRGDGGHGGNSTGNPAWSGRSLRRKGFAVPGDRMGYGRVIGWAVPGGIGWARRGERCRCPVPVAHLRVPASAAVHRQNGDPAPQRAPPAPGRPLWDGAGSSPRPGAVARAGREGGAGGDGKGRSSRSQPPSTGPGRSRQSAAIPPPRPPRCWLLRVIPNTSLECLRQD